MNKTIKRLSIAKNFNVMMNDTSRMRSDTVNNRLSHEILKRYYMGSDSKFTGKSDNFPSHVNWVQVLVEGESFSDFIEQVTLNDPHSLSLTLLSTVTTQRQGDVGFKERMLNHKDLMVKVSAVMDCVKQDQMRGYAFKDNSQVSLSHMNISNRRTMEDRPSTCSKEIVDWMELKGSATPSLHASILVATVIFINMRFDLSELELTDLKSSAYIMAMFVVMSGRNHIPAVLYTMRDMWDLKLIEN